MSRNFFLELQNDKRCAAGSYRLLTEFLSDLGVNRANCSLGASSDSKSKVGPMTILRLSLLSVLILMGTNTASAQEADVAANPFETPDVPAPEPEQIDSAIRNGVEFLLGAQNKDGSWGSATRTKGLNIYAPIPGAHHAFRTGVTSLVLCALIETAPEDPVVRKAIDRGADWMVEKLPRLRRAAADAIYNVWGHAYAIQALVRLHGLTDDAERQAVYKKLILEQFDKLGRYESVDGGWGYYDFRAGARKPTSSSISFVNATVLIAFKEADDLGIKPPEKLVKRAIAATNRQKKPDFSYLYGEYLQYQPMRGVNRPGGSLGRSQACNCALRVWGDKTVTDEVLKTWLTRLYVRNGWLDIGRKRPVPHEAWFQVAGYFYYYGHYYAALCIDLLPEEERPIYQAMLSTLILRLQEKDGSWWDYPLYNYHQPYGTAYALMTLVRCLPPESEQGEASGAGVPERNE